MKSNLILYIIYSFFIKIILLSEVPDLEKYKILTNFETPFLTFDSRDFNVDEEIYFKITGRFQHSQSYVEYRFYDDINEKQNLIDGVFELNREFSYKVDRKYDDYGTILYEIKFFTICKKSEQLGDLKGNFLFIRTYMFDIYSIENIKVNKGYERIVGIIVACVVIAVIIVVIIVYYIRRKQKMRSLIQASGSGNQINNNINGNSPNFGGQQLVPIQNNNSPNN